MQVKARFASDKAAFFFEKLLDISQKFNGTIDPFRVAKWERQLGDCYMRLGAITQAIPHLEKCLVLHGQSTPGYLLRVLL